MMLKQLLEALNKIDDADLPDVPVRIEFGDGDGYAHEGHITKVTFDKKADLVYVTVEES